MLVLYFSSPDITNAISICLGNNNKACLHIYDTNMHNNIVPNSVQGEKDVPT
jgi:hypothetical protein